MQAAKWAMCGGHETFLQNLLQKYAYPAEDPEFRKMLLHHAITSGHLKQTQTLLHELETPLDPETLPIISFDYAILAAQHGQFNIYYWLTRTTTVSCKPHSRNELVKVLFAAAKFDNLQLVHYLIESPAANKKRLKLELTTEFEDQDITLIALNAGALKVLRYIYNKMPKLLERKVGPTQVQALHFAASAGKNTACILLVKEFKHDSQSQDSKGSYSIHCAASSGNWSCYWLLVNEFFKDNPLLPNTQKETPLHYAALLGHYWFLKKALQYFGKEPFQVLTINDNTLLHNSICAMRLPIVRLMVDEIGLDLRSKNCDGNTPLHYLAVMLTRSNKPNWQYLDDILNLYGVDLLHEENNSHKSVMSLLPPAIQQKYQTGPALNL